MTQNQELAAIITAARTAEANKNLKSADELWDKALSLGSDNIEALNESARVGALTGDFKKSVARLEKVLALKPSAKTVFDLALCYRNIGEFTKAEKLVRRNIEANPKDFTNLNLLGIILKQQERYQEALDVFLKNSKAYPSNISSWINLGNCYTILEKFPQAIEAFTKATKLEPKNGENFRLLAGAYSKAGQFNKALSTLQAALLRSGKSNPKIRLDISGIYYLLRDFNRALFEIEKAIEIHSDLPELLRRQAVILRKLGRANEAVPILEKILNSNPSDLDTLLALGNIYSLSLGDKQKANEYFERAYNLNPKDRNAAAQYCESLINSRYGTEAEHIEKAYVIARKMLEDFPATASLASATQSIFLRNVDYESYGKLGNRRELLQAWVNTMSAHELHSQLGRVESMEDRLYLVDMHKSWGEKIEKAAAAAAIKKSPHAARSKIRIGLMSSDLRNHPVTYFVEPILNRYNKDKFELYCYSFYNGKPDSMQQHIAKTVDKFGLYLNNSDADIAREIAADDLDILFELGGTTYLNRLEVMAYRPAPVQVSWLGYPHSAGIPAIDYILVDPYIKPEIPGLILEKPFMMPETWVVLSELGFKESSVIEPGIPYERNKYITFGTMNNPYKYTPLLFKAWAEIMNKVPNSRFLFVRPEGNVKPFRDNVIKEFAKHGVAAERIEFFAIRGAHLPYYNKIDIALDTFPHTGGTTTCESLWMGVPTVTLVGPAFFERLSYSNLSNAGLSDLCAHNREDYVNIAVKLAGNQERLLTLRHGLRKQIRDLPLGQVDRFVRNFEEQVVKTLDKDKERQAV